jgi:hypothetical protein
MPKDKTETYQKIISCAKRKFLAKGFEKFITVGFKQNYENEDVLAF